MPIITLSRQYGSGGSVIAARVAEALGWPLLDNAFVEAVAQAAGADPSEVAAREERVPSLVERVLAALALGSPESLPALADAALPLSEERLVAVTKRVIEEAAASGPVVLVGRGAQAVLARRHDVLHVLCHAPPEALVRRAMERLATDAERAREVVEETNRQRHQFVRKYFQREWLGIENYHLCIDTDAFGLDGAAALVEAAARRKFGLGSRSG